MDTLEHLADNIRTWHDSACDAGRNFFGYRFLIGRALLDAEKIIPRAKPGPKPKTELVPESGCNSPFEDEGVLKWKRREFPEIPNQTLHDYKQFAARVLATHPELATVDFHALPDSQREEVLAKLRSGVKGRDVTLGFRAMGLLDDATPAGGFRPNTGELETWLQRHHPGHAGKKWHDLSAKIQGEFMAAVRAREARRTAKGATGAELLERRRWEAKQEVNALLPRLKKWARERTLLVLEADDQAELQRLFRALVDQLERSTGRKQGGAAS